MVRTAALDASLEPSRTSSRAATNRRLVLLATASLRRSGYLVRLSPVAMDIAAWALFAISVDLLLGYTGLLSFGHAAFWVARVRTGLIALSFGVPFPVAIIGGMVFAMLIAVPIGYLSVRRAGIYFAMVTLAFAQMIYFAANQWKDITGERTACRASPRLSSDREGGNPAFYFYYVAIVMILAGMLAAWRIVHSPFGRVLVAIRDNPARARALGYASSGTS